MQDFRKLRVWQANRAYTLEIYRVTAKYPVDERFCLISQMRRAVIRVGACIAEGCGRKTRKDTLHYFQMSFSSSTELLHHLITSGDLKYLRDSDLQVMEAKLEEIRKMLAGLMRKLRGAD